MMEDNHEVSKNMAMKRRKGKFGINGSGQTFKATGVITTQTRKIQRDVTGDSGYYGICGGPFKF